MNNIHQNLATSIHDNAKQLLKFKKIESTIQEQGNLVYTGSYALNLMTWNDIDMQIIFKDDVKPIDGMTKLHNLFIRDPETLESQIIIFQGDYKPKMPRGIYLGIKINAPQCGGVWKLDLWSLAKPDFEKNRMLIEKLKSQLTPESRDLILKIKQELMEGNNRVPQMGSHILYQAILLEGIKEKKAIYDYLINHGVSLKNIKES